MYVDLHVYNLSLLSWIVHCWNLEKLVDFIKHLLV